MTRRHDATAGDGNADCSCLRLTASHDQFDRRYIGVDRRYGDVHVNTCRQCGRVWLHYHVEYEAFSRSGRWIMGLITPEQAAAITAEDAEPILSAMPWYLFGGSYYDGRKGRGRGPAPVDLNPSRIGTILEWLP